MNSATTDQPDPLLRFSPTPHQHREADEDGGDDQGIEHGAGDHDGAELHDDFREESSTVHFAPVE